MSAVDGSHPRPRTSVAEPITLHVDVYLEGDRDLRACVEAAGSLGIPVTQYALNEAISFRIAEQQIYRNTWICCLCQESYTVLGFQRHACAYPAAVMTATLIKFTEPQHYIVADSVTTLRYLKTGTLDGNSWARLMWKLLTQHLVTLFLTCMHEVSLPMRQILTEELLENSVVAAHQTIDTIYSLLRELEAQDDSTSEESD
ncbi:hypothetical protein CALCODRAFT_383072 [Calocera cornea HHB12733]|uniref:Uncharacterized protein n=1 Tax=Calocera cornea HHB12733 TaxID=1353952 RepID=A0A165EC41_9BASI|nr:hypothetical protein CALCODRAFT_383072 [Calocera cornea HHB12733]